MSKKKWRLVMEIEDDGIGDDPETPSFLGRAEIEGSLSLDESGLTFEIISCEEMSS